MPVNGIEEVDYELHYEAGKVYVDDDIFLVIENLGKMPPNGEQCFVLTRDGEIVRWFLFVSLMKEIR